MKVVCINNDIEYRMTFADPFYEMVRYNLTSGKVYDVSRITRLDYEIIDDTGVLRSFPQERFVTLNKHRMEKINKIL